jgi:hypothetical protein
MFFSEEKNQKTFVSSACTEIVELAGEAGASGGHKSLLVLFFRKEHAFVSFKQT